MTYKYNHTDKLVWTVEFTPGWYKPADWITPADWQDFEIQEILDHKGVDIIDMVGLYELTMIEDECKEYANNHDD